MQNSLNIFTIPSEILQIFMVVLTKDQMSSCTLAAFEK